VRSGRQQLVYEVVRRTRRGESKRGIARALGIAPRTVTGILASEEARRSEGETALSRELPARRAPRASKLDAYAARIDAWLEEYPDLTATRLHEKLVEVGFAGRYTIVRQHLKALRGRKKPKRAVEIVETLPGQQGQFDWSPFPLEDGTTAQLWSHTLSWSRGRSFAATDNTRQTTILERLAASFVELGGAPGECVTDSMPGVVDRWECGRPILNVRFVDFAAYYRFAVHIAPRGDGAPTRARSSGPSATPTRTSSTGAPSAAWANCARCWRGGRRTRRCSGRTRGQAGRSARCSTRSAPICRRCPGARTTPATWCNGWSRDARRTERRDREHAAGFRRPSRRRCTRS
jgi:transposase